MARLVSLQRISYRELLSSDAECLKGSSHEAAPKAAAILLKKTADKDCVFPQEYAALVGSRMFLVSFY